MPATILEAHSLAQTLQTVFGTGPLGLIFDCDGVLIDSRAANTSYYNLLREAVCLPPMSHEQEDYVHMSSVTQAIEAIIPRPLQTLLPKLSRNISYSRDIMPHLRPMPGIIPLLNYCQSQGLLLGIDTNRQDTMPEILKWHHLEGYFSIVITAAQVTPKPDPAGPRLILQKWQISPRQALFIGDSLADQEAACGAQIPFLAYDNPNLDALASISSFTILLEALQLLHA